MAWDHRGRLWIAETIDYPNNLQPPGEGHDRIKICEDTDGDGKADKFTVFADKLSIPTSLAFANGGLIVHQAPDTLFLKDTDGDDKADVRKVLFTGWGTDDTHAGPSNLRYGLRQLALRDRRLLRASTARSAASATSSARGSTGSSPTARSWSSSGARTTTPGASASARRGCVFGSTANGCPSVYLPIPNRYYETVRGWSPSVLANIADSNRFFPVTEKVRQVDWHGGFTAGAGPRPLHRPDLSRSTTGTGPRSSPSRPGHLVATFLLEPQGQRLRLAQRLEPRSPATTSGPRRSPPRSAPTATSG